MTSAIARSRLDSHMLLHGFEIGMLHYAELLGVRARPLFLLRLYYVCGGSNVASRLRIAWRRDAQQYGSGRGTLSVWRGMNGSSAQTNRELLSG